MGTNEQSNQTVSYHVRCECSYCEHCIKEVSIYNECEGCYDGFHPCLPRISWDFENHLKRKWLLWKETRPEEIPDRHPKLTTLKQFIRQLTLRRIG